MTTSRKTKRSPAPRGFAETTQKKLKRALRTFERRARAGLDDLLERAIDPALDRLGLVRKSKLETA